MQKNQNYHLEILLNLIIYLMKMIYLNKNDFIQNIIFLLNLYKKKKIFYIL